jgi:hypothetical protein
MGAERFDERGYKLSPREDTIEEGGDGTDEGEGGGKKGLDVFRGKPWLRR